MNNSKLTLSNSQVSHSGEPASEGTKADVWVRINRLEAQLHQQQQNADRRYAKVKAQLDSLQLQLSSLVLATREAIKKATKKSPHDLWLSCSIALNIILLIALLVVTSKVGASENSLTDRQRPPKVCDSVAQFPQHPPQQGQAKANDVAVATFEFFHK